MIKQTRSAFCTAIVTGTVVGDGFRYAVEVAVDLSALSLSLPL